METQLLSVAPFFTPLSIVPQTDPVSNYSYFLCYVKHTQACACALTNNKGSLEDAKETKQRESLCQLLCTNKKGRVERKRSGVEERRIWAF